MTATDVHEHTTASGITYHILKQGDGAQPKASSTVTVQYEGRLPDGTVFDSSYKRGEPISFTLTSVITGWQEVLPMMHVGSQWEVVIPPALAYGAHGIPGVIPPNTALTFVIELLGVDAAKA